MDLELISSILIIIGIDILLGGDNAIVIALACRNLPGKQRNNAIVLGTFIAILLRFLLTIVALYLLEIPFLQFIGGCLLVVIAFKLLHEHDESKTNISSGLTIGAAVKTIVFADLVMGLDNVVAVAGAAKGQLYLVFFGLLVSVPIIIWGSKVILYGFERFPILIYIGAGVLAYTAGSMMVGEEMLKEFYISNPLICELIPPLTICLVLGSNFFTKRLRMD